MVQNLLCSVPVRFSEKTQICREFSSTGSVISKTHPCSSFSQCLKLDRPAMRAEPCQAATLLAMIEADQTSSRRHVVKYVVEKNSIEASKLDDTDTDHTSLRRHARSWNGTRSKHRDLALRICASPRQSLDRLVVSGQIDYECSQTCDQTLTGTPSQTASRDLGSVKITYTKLPADSSTHPTLLDFMQFFGMDHTSGAESQHFMPICGSGPALLEERTANKYQDVTEHNPRLREILELLLGNNEASIWTWGRGSQSHDLT